MLKAAFSRHEKSVQAELSESEENPAPPSSTTTGSCPQPSQRTKGMLRMVSQTWLTIVTVSALLIASSAAIRWQSP
nr:MbeB family mobilization protein [Pantoea stewartii]